MTGTRAKVGTQKWAEIFHTQNTGGQRGVEDMHFCPSQWRPRGRVTFSALPAKMSVDV